MANSCSYLQLYPTSGAWIEIMHKSGKKGKYMELQELGLSDIQMRALEKKKVVSVEALLRRPPLHYYDFSKTYPLSLKNPETAEMLEKNRPFAVSGECIRFGLGEANHAKCIKLVIEDEDTKSGFAGSKGQVLYVNILGYDQFRQTFLNDCKDSPHRMEIHIPDGVDAYYQGEKRQVNDSCRKRIEFLNSLDETAVRDFIAVKTNGVDGWSRSKISDIADEDTVRFLEQYFDMREDILGVLKWYARGMRLDFAIKKTLIDDTDTLRKLILHKRFLVGGFIRYDELRKFFSVLNPVAFSSNFERFEKYDVQYGQVKGVTPDRYEELIKRASEGISSMDFLPASVCRQYNVPAFKESVMMMHYPNTYGQVKKAKERTLVEDLLYFALKLEVSNKRNDDIEGVRMDDFFLVEKYVSSLPYDLTGDQKRSVETICRKMASGSPVNALVQGDVGTGKTAVAFCLLLAAAGSGYQAALAAPYTTLAFQHCRDMEKIAEMVGVKVAFLTSDIKGKKKKETLEMIRSGEAQVIIGTHSIFSSDVEYKNLALIITDEEHKFGVVHRDSFREKALEGFHQITMSATPIPKSIAATLYDDTMDIISIKDKPANRIPVQTAVCQKDITALKFMEQQIGQGRQCYVVCPAIEKNDKAEKMASITEKEEVYRRYLESKGMNLAVVTGKLKTAEKQQIMEDFSGGKIDVLMATTVIEVGINVPNATVMVITGAERFGFSTLHQLRGRVGRGEYKSYCILQTTESNEKLQFMCETTDGFEIAEKDLELRGPGSMFGERQSGDNYYVSLMLANQELFKKLKGTAKELCKDATGKDIIRRYEEIFRAEEER